MYKMIGQLLKCLQQRFGLFSLACSMKMRRRMQKEEEEEEEEEEEHEEEEQEQKQEEEEQQQILRSTSVHVSLIMYLF